MTMRLMWCFFFWQTHNMGVSQATVFWPKIFIFSRLLNNIVSTSSGTRSIFTWNQDILSVLLGHDTSSNWTLTGLQYIFITQSLFILVEGHRIVTSWCVKQQLALPDLGHMLHKMEMRLFIHFTIFFFLFNIDSINCCITHS